MNTHVKPVMSVTMQQRRQPLMCSVSKSFPFLCINSFFYVSIAVLKLIFLTLFLGLTCLFVTHDSKIRVNFDVPMTVKNGTPILVVGAV